MRKYIFFVSVVMLGILLDSCGDTFSTVVEIDPPDFESKMTITSFVEAQDTVVGFFVGRNRGILEEGDFRDYELDSVSVAVRKEGTGETISAVKPVDPFGVFSFASNYVLVDIPPQYFEGGNSYTFSVSHQDYPESVTTLVLPSAEDNLENIVYKQNDGVDLEGDDSSSVSFDIVDDANAENYYELELFSVNGFNNFGTFWIESTDPSGVKGFPDDNIFFSDESFNGEVKNIKVKFDQWNYDPANGDKLELYWRSISKDTYEYSKSSKRYSDTDGTPFLSPVQLHSNVNNALGNISMKSEVLYEIQ